MILKATDRILSREFGFTIELQRVRGILLHVGAFDSIIHHIRGQVDQVFLGGKFRQKLGGSDVRSASQIGVTIAINGATQRGTMYDHVGLLGAIGIGKRL